MSKRVLCGLGSLRRCRRYLGPVQIPSCCGAAESPTNRCSIPARVVTLTYCRASSLAGGACVKSQCLSACCLLVSFFHFTLMPDVFKQDVPLSRYFFSYRKHRSIQCKSHYKKVWIAGNEDRWAQRSFWALRVRRRTISGEGAAFLTALIPPFPLNCPLRGRVEVLFRLGPM